MASVYPDNEYVPEHNERFVREPFSAAYFHGKLRRGLDLRRVFCQDKRRVTPWQ